MVENEKLEKKSPYKDQKKQSDKSPSLFLIYFVILNTMLSFTSVRMTNYI